MRLFSVWLLLCGFAVANRANCETIASQLPSAPEVVQHGRVNQQDSRRTAHHINAVMQDYFMATPRHTQPVGPYVITRYEADYATFVLVVQMIPPFTWCVLANSLDYH